MQLKIFAYATEYFMETYSKGLSDDCAKYGYDLHLEVVPYGSFSHLNHYIHIKMIEVVRNAGPEDRILFLDPECRIHKPIPQEWIDDPRPIVFYKINHGKHQREQYQYGHTLHGPIQMQPVFLTAKDITWWQWWFDASLAGSDPERNVYVPHELFLELALNFNKIDRREEHCIYNRAYDKHKHLVVKGSWVTEDTIITHPAIHGYFDMNVKHANDERDNLILEKRELHNHFQDFDLIQQIDILMLKEKDTGWPQQCTKKGDWFSVDEWQFNPKQGLLKRNEYDLEKYHYHLQTKLDKGLLTPVVKAYNERGI